MSACSEPSSSPTTAPAGDNSAHPAAASGNPIVVLDTSTGTIELELFEEKAPISVKNFLSYVDKKHYDGTIFHRVIKDFMIQGGGFDESGAQRTPDAPIKNEADNGLKNERGTVAMARTGVVDSATAQFFINHKDNEFLNFKAPTTAGYGYTVFGRVVSGMDVVDAIAKTPVKNKGGALQNAPVESVVIKSARLRGAD